jgi:hypothetical protein
MAEETKVEAPYGYVEVFCAGCGKELSKKPAAQPGQFKTYGCCSDCFPPKSEPAPVVEESKVEEVHGDQNQT